MQWCVFLAAVFFFFNDTATTEIYTLSLHDALPIFSGRKRKLLVFAHFKFLPAAPGVNKRRHLAAIGRDVCLQDRKSTRLNSSHMSISYAVFCLKKKKRQLYQCPRNFPSSLSCC